MSLTPKQQELFDANEKLAYAVAHATYTKLLPCLSWVPEFEDVKQIALIGLFKAVQKYRTDKDAAFSSYAYPTIEGHVKRYMLEDSAPVRLPRVRPEMAEETKAVRERTLRIISTCRSLDEVVSSDEYQQERERYELIIDFDKNIELFENSLEIQEAIKQLNEEERVLIALRYGEDLTQQQIADKLGTMNQPTVGKKIKKALKKLEAILTNGGQNEISNLC